jgi:hypothetical protein
MAVDLPCHPTSTCIVCFYFTDFLSTSLFDRFLNRLPYPHPIRLLVSRSYIHLQHTPPLSTYDHDPIRDRISLDCSSILVWKFDPNILGVKKNHLYNMDHLGIHEPISNQMHSNPLVDYVRSYHRHTLHFNDTTGDITWKSRQGPTWVNQYHGNPTPYTTLHSQSDAVDPFQSHSVDPFNHTTRTQHATNAVEIYEATDDIQDLFRVQSTLADEGLVGITYLWKWVKRMLVLPYWQRRVLVSFASDIPSGDLQWYTIGISISRDNITLCVKDRIWAIDIGRLLAADLEDVSPFTSTGESLLLSGIKWGITTGSLAIVSDTDTDTDTESASPNVIFTVSVLH